MRLELIHDKRDGIQGFTRHNTNCTKAFLPEFETLSFSDDLILDCELICYDPEEKRDSWELVMERFRLQNEIKIRHTAEELPCTLIVFDVLYYKKPLLDMQLIERKMILEELFDNTPVIQKTAFLDTEGQAFFEQIKQLQLEGAVAKKKNSKYAPGKRVDFWKKIVRYEYYQVVIRGFKKSEFGLLCSFEEEGKLKPAGVIEFATPFNRKLFYNRAAALKGEEDKLNVYLKEGIPATVKTRGLTKKGYLRTPVLLELH
ncbi:ATP-dependent DNA ligase [Cytobacillus firmus]